MNPPDNLMISTQVTARQLDEAMLAEYEVSRDDIERDVLALVQTLLERQLVSVGA